MSLALAKKPTIIILTETGDTKQTDILQWSLQLHNLDPKNPSHMKQIQHHHTQFPYDIHITPNTEPGTRGGIIILIHKTWQHRKLNKPITPPHQRWSDHTLTTPTGKLHIIGIYGRPSPAGKGTKATNMEWKAKAKAEWLHLHDHLNKLHAKGHGVILAGDFNLTRNTPTCRAHISNNLTQHKLLTGLEEIGGLTDVFNHLHPSSLYSTFHRTNTWTSPDHIMISSHLCHTLLQAQTDYTPIKEGISDHRQVTVTMSTPLPTKSRIPTHTKTQFNTKRSAEYGLTVKAILDQHSPPDDLTQHERIDHLQTACIDTYNTMFKKKAHLTTKTFPKLQLFTDIKILKQTLHHINTTPSIPIPQHIHQKQVIKRLKQITPQHIHQAIRIYKKQYNKLTTKRRRAMFTSFRTSRRQKLSSQNFKGFLASALNRRTNFRGIIGYYTTDTANTGIDTSPDNTKHMATERISQHFYKPRIPPPPYHTHSTRDTWLALPPWYKNTFHNTQHPSSSTIYDNILDPASPDELKSTIKRMKRKKAGGPSGLTTDMLYHLLPDTQDTWILPILNHALRTHNLPSLTKKFQVWATEKQPGAGSILKLTGKINVRPISLFEVLYKLLELLIKRRLNVILTKHNIIDKNQYGFTKNVGVDDLLMTYNFIMEGAFHSQKEIHISNNDCSQAYDAIPPWAMRTIYHYHHFPPELIDLLMNLDTDQTGTVITAHGEGHAFTKTCGLGQGSILAPLKWKLFLNPLLRLLRTTGDPLILENDTPLTGKAFADDLTIFAPTHADYTLRMNMTNQYLGFFGVELSPQKTTYTYMNTPTHKPSAHIWNRPDSYTHTNTASPHTALRYLGGWMCPGQAWSTAKTHLISSIVTPLQILRYKRLTWNEFKYIINTVINMKALYPLTVIPCTEEELRPITSLISKIARQILRVPASCPSQLIYTPTRQGGFGLKRLTEERDILLIKQAHRLLQDQSELGHLARTRLAHLRNHSHLTTNPLDTPHLIPKLLYKTHWFARVGQSLINTNSRIRDPHNLFRLPSPRSKDHSLHSILPADIYHALRPNLQKHNMLWISSISNPAGTHILYKPKQHPPTTSYTWTTLHKLLTQEDNKTLTHTTSPLPNSFFTVHTHKPGDIVYVPQEDESGFHPPSQGQYMKVVSSTRDENDRDLSLLKPLQLDTKRPTLALIEGTWSGITNIHALTTSPRPPSHYFADAILPVPHSFITVRKTKSSKPRTDILILHDHHIQTTSGLHRGPLSIKKLHTLHKTITDRFQRINDETHSKADTNDAGTCDVCKGTGHLLQCTRNTHCSGWSHKQCTNPTSAPYRRYWSCDKCTTRYIPSHTHSLTAEEHRRLSTRSTWDSSGDGSVHTRPTPSSTWSIYIDTSPPIHRSGKITIRPGDESSLRVELEALIQLYKILPPSTTTNHACDNESAIAIHQDILNEYTPPIRHQLNSHYRSTIQRLRQIMRTRTQHINITHTHSHLEHIHTDDPLLNKRRRLLAIADRLADEAHDLPPSPFDHGGDELFPLYINDTIIEKNITQTLHHILGAKNLDSLTHLKTDGALQALSDPPPWKSTLHTLPPHIQNFRHKLWLRRLPTRQERARRQETHATGTPISPQCPVCNLVPGEGIRQSLIESHTHVFTQCSYTKIPAAQLRYNINNYLRHKITFGHSSNTTAITKLRKIIKDDNLHLRWSTPEHTPQTDKHGRALPGPSPLPYLTSDRNRHFSRRADVFAKQYDQRHHLHHSLQDIYNYRPTGTVTDPYLLSALNTHMGGHLTLTQGTSLPHINTTCLDIRNLGRSTHKITQHLPSPTSPNKGILIDAADYDLQYHPQITQFINDTHTFSNARITIICQPTHLPPSFRQITTIPANRIHRITRSYWAGTRPTTTQHTHDTKLIVATNFDTDETAHNLEQIISHHYISSLTNMPFSTSTHDAKPNTEQQHHATPPPTILPLKYREYKDSSIIYPYTPTSLRTLWLPHDNKPNLPLLHLLAGELTNTHLNDLKDSGIPPNKLPTVYKYLQRTILQYSHNIWTTRNASITDATQITHDTLHRIQTKKRRHPAHTTPNTTHDKEAHRFHRKRHKSLQYLTYWHTLSTTHRTPDHSLNPAPPKHKRKRSSITDPNKRPRITQHANPPADIHHTPPIQESPSGNPDASWSRRDQDRRTPSPTRGKVAPLSEEEAASPRAGYASADDTTTTGTEDTDLNDPEHGDNQDPRPSPYDSDVEPAFGLIQYNSLNHASQPTPEPIRSRLPPSDILQFIHPNRHTQGNHSVPNTRIPICQPITLLSPKPRRKRKRTTIQTHKRTRRRLTHKTDTINTPSITSFFRPKHPRQHQPTTNPSNAPT